MKDDTEKLQSDVFELFQRARDLQVSAGSPYERTAAAGAKVHLEKANRLLHEGNQKAKKCRN